MLQIRWQLEHTAICPGRTWRTLGDADPGWVAVVTVRGCYGALTGRPQLHHTCGPVSHNHLYRWGHYARRWTDRRTSLRALYYSPLLPRSERRVTGGPSPRLTGQARPGSTHHRLTPPTTASVATNAASAAAATADVAAVAAADEFCTASKWYGNTVTEHQFILPITRQSPTLILQIRTICHLFISRGCFIYQNHVNVQKLFEKLINYFSINPIARWTAYKDTVFLSHALSGC